MTVGVLLMGCGGVKKDEGTRRGALVKDSRRENQKGHARHTSCVEELFRQTSTKGRRGPACDLE